MKMNHRNQYEETYDKVEGVVSVPYQAKGPIPNYQNIAPLPNNDNYENNNTGNNQPVSL